MIYTSFENSQIIRACTPLEIVEERSSLIFSREAIEVIET